MSMRMVFVISVILNFALAGVIFSRLDYRRAGVIPDRERITNTVAGVRAVERKETKTYPAAPAEFHWGLIETNDYRVYLANLRGVGCPEKTIQDILIADIEKRFAAKQAALPANENFWQTASQREAANRKRQKLERELEEEKHALIQELLGVDWNQEARKLWREEKFAELVLGFLPEPKPMQVLEAFVRTEKMASAIREEAGGIEISEDVEKRKKLSDELRLQFSQWLSRDELEEFFARTQTMIDSEVNSENLVGVDLAGNEYRELMKLKVKGTDLFGKMLDLTEESEGHEHAAQEQFEAGARSLLGEARFAAVQRSQDYRFQQAYQAAREFDLPADAAIKVYELRQAAEAEAQRLRADPSLPKEQQRAALRGIGAEAQQAIAAVFGEKATQSYLKRDGQWLKNLAGRTNAKPSP